MKLGALSSLSADIGSPARMSVLNPDTQMPLVDSDGRECYIDFLSVDSDVGRRLDREQVAAQRRRFRSGQDIESEDDIGIQANVLASLATGWNFGADADEFSKSAAAALFGNNEYGWLRRQAWVFVHSAANFIRSSSKNS